MKTSDRTKILTELRNEIRDESLQYASIRHGFDQQHLSKLLDWRVKIDMALSLPDTGGSDYIDFNINDHVWVKLRRRGKDILRERDLQWSRIYNCIYGRLPIAERDETHNNGWSRFQFWSLIDAFGPSLYLGCDPPFETVIRVEKK